MEDLVLEYIQAIEGVSKQEQIIKLLELKLDLTHKENSKEAIDLINQRIYELKK